MDEDARNRLLRIAITVLFGLYCIPFVFLAVSAIVTGGWQYADLVLKAFVGFTRTQDQSLALLHRALLPLMAAFAPVAFMGSANNRWASLFMIMLLVAISLSIGLSALLNSPQIVASVKATGVFTTPGGSGLQSSADAALVFNTGMQQITSFFNRTQEALGMYLLMLFGLKATEPKP